MNMILRAAAFAAGIALAAPAMAQTKWDMPTPYPDTNFHTVNISQFAADVKEKTGGKIDIVVHAGGSLVKHGEIKNAVRSGQVPVGEFLLSTLANENPVFGVDSVPFLATSYEASKKLWDASRAKTEELLAQQDLMVLFSVPWPPQGLYTKKDVAGPDDLKGLKFRAYNAATERVAQLSGMVPTQVEVPDIAQAFLTGRVEAMITSPSTGANSKAWDYLSNYYDLQAWLPKNIVVVNKSAFDGLDDATKQAVLDAAKAAETRGWEASMAETDSKTKVLSDNGIKVSAPSEALATAMKEIGAQMTEDWLKSAGDDGKAIVDKFKM
ncbi:MAG: TRAP transporter substrate-binding protein [Flavobacteriaceae bacterium]